jgi:hypothetical protein
VHQGTGEGDLLQHALGKAAAEFVGVRAKAEPIDQFVGGAFGAVRLHLPETGDEFEIFERGQAIIDHGFVGNPGHEALGGDGIGQGIDAENGNGAAVGFEKTRDHTQNGGLAGAVGAEQGIEFARLDRQVDALDHRAVERLGETGNGKGGGHGGLQ